MLIHRKLTGQIDMVIWIGQRQYDLATITNTANVWSSVEEEAFNVTSDLAQTSRHSWNVISSTSAEYARAVLDIQMLRFSRIDSDCSTYPTPRSLTLALARLWAALHFFPAVLPLLAPADAMELLSVQLEHAFNKIFMRCGFGQSGGFIESRVPPYGCTCMVAVLLLTN